MRNRNRREFLADVGRGMLVAAVGAGVAQDMGLGTAFAKEGSDALTFGKLEPLVGLMEDTPPDRLLPLLAGQLKQGTQLREMVAATALANARAFGGEDYVGFHTFMALSPAYAMSQELPSERQALPVFKVIYRNSNRLQETGGRKAEVLHPVKPMPVPEGVSGAEYLRSAMRRKDMNDAEQTFACLAQVSAEEAFNSLLAAVEDATEVHRVVLPYRAWDMIDLAGSEFAHTLLRQSVRYCVKAETPSYIKYFSESRVLLPKLFDQFRLMSRPLGSRQADDSWVEKTSQTLFKCSAAQAAETAAAALAEGMAPEAVAEAISLAVNQLILRDRGRPQNQTSPGKPVGSVHGDSIGVHACDSANAWRNMARVSNQRNKIACLVLSAYQAAQDRLNRGGEFQSWTPYPLQQDLAAIKTSDARQLLAEAEDAIRHNDQARAAALVGRYGELGHPHRAVFDLLLKYAISEDGALHAEKYYRTVSDEFASTRTPFRWRQLIGLARVTASEYGRPAPGVEDACRLLKV